MGVGYWGGCSICGVLGARINHDAVCGGVGRWVGSMRVLLRMVVQHCTGRRGIR